MRKVIALTFAVFLAAAAGSPAFGSAESDFCSELAAGARTVASLRDQGVPRATVKQTVRNSPTTGPLDGPVKELYLNMVDAIYDNTWVSPSQARQGMYQSCMENFQ